jgi:hypothetical protein
MVAWLLHPKASGVGARPAATGLAAMYALTIAIERMVVTGRSLNRRSNRCPVRA